MEVKVVRVIVYVRVVAAGALGVEFGPRHVSNDVVPLVHIDGVALVDDIRLDLGRELSRESREGRPVVRQ